MGYARLVRGQVLRAREFEYVQAARALGAGTPRILWRHVIPTAIPALVVQATLGMAGAIIGEASLSFLGLGVQPPTPSWGTMLNGGRAHILDAPHLTIFPGLAIALLVLGFNFLGDGLRDRLDPRRQVNAAGASPKLHPTRHEARRLGLLRRTPTMSSSVRRESCDVDLAISTSSAQSAVFRVRSSSRALGS